MKNVIAYYYNLHSYDIHQYKDIYKFSIANTPYVLSPCNIMEIKSVYEFNKTLIQNGIYISRIIPTVFNEIYISINNKPYILIQFFDDIDRKINLQDIIVFNNSIQHFNQAELNVPNWGQLWSNKIDYFEYQVSQFGRKFPQIRESFSYYIGLAETGISLYFNHNTSNNYILSGSHKRIKSDSTLYDLYNPLNLIVDFKVRDAVEYFKDLFLTKENIFEDIIEYFSHQYLSSDECFFFFVRMFYPSFYFDAYEKIIEQEIEESKLDKITCKTEEYENLLKKLYVYLSNYIEMPDIEWLKKT